MVNISEIEDQVALLYRIENYKTSTCKRLWWIVDDASSLAVQRNLVECKTLLDQVGIDKSEVIKALGPRNWTKAITDIANEKGFKYFVLGSFSRCTFVSIRTKEDGDKETGKPIDGILVQKKSDEAKSVTKQLELEKEGNVDLEHTSECASRKRTRAATQEASSANTRGNRNKRRGQSTLRPAPDNSSQARKPPPEKNQRNSAMISPLLKQSDGEKKLGRGCKTHRHWDKLTTQRAGEIFRGIMFEEDGESLRMDNMKLILEDGNGKFRPEVRDMIIGSNLGHDILKLFPAQHTGFVSLDNTTSSRDDFCEGLSHSRLQGVDPDDPRFLQLLDRLDYFRDSWHSKQCQYKVGANDLDQNSRCPHCRTLENNIREARFPELYKDVEQVTDRSISEALIWRTTVHLSVAASATLLKSGCIGSMPVPSAKSAGPMTRIVDGIQNAKRPTRSNE